jgi:hypothetical protein
VRIRKAIDAWPLSWWVTAILATFLGLGTTLHYGSALGHSSGWSLVGAWCWIAGGVFVFVGFGWIAIEKFRARSDVPQTVTE